MTRALYQSSVIKTRYCSDIPSEFFWYEIPYRRIAQEGCLGHRVYTQVRPYVSCATDPCAIACA